MPSVANACNNLNHRRRDAPVRCCPNCGAVVNAKMAAAKCPPVRHADRRKSGSSFCVDCGDQLVKDR